MLPIPTEIKLSLRAIKWGLIAALFLGTNVASYFYGRESYEDELNADNVEVITENAVDNAKRVESQVTRIERATQRLDRAAANTERSVNENDQVNLDPSCSTSPDELQSFNEAIRQANSGVSVDRAE
jgi:hypothetical protein